MTGSVFASLDVAFLMVIAGSMLLFHLNKNPEAGRYVYRKIFKNMTMGISFIRCRKGICGELEQIDDKFET